jgi:hypothetical protein
MHNRALLPRSSLKDPWKTAAIYENNMLGSASLRRTMANNAEDIHIARINKKVQISAVKDIATGSDVKALMSRVIK